MRERSTLRQAQRGEEDRTVREPWLRKPRGLSGLLIFIEEFWDRHVTHDRVVIASLCLCLGYISGLYMGFTSARKQPPPHLITQSIVYADTYSACLREFDFYVGLSLPSKEKVPGRCDSVAEAAVESLTGKKKAK